MADQKKWFKVWASILNDGRFMNLGFDQRGRWCWLGALICQQGINGKLTIIPPSEALLSMFKVTTLDELQRTLLALPNVTITPLMEGHGGFVVAMRNWYKYQVDTTHAYRKYRARHKKRGEEKLTTTSTSSPSRSRSAKATRGAQEEEDGTSGGIGFSEQVKRLREGRLYTDKT